MSSKSPEGDVDESYPQVGDLVMFYWKDRLVFGTVSQLIWPRPHEADIGIGTSIEVKDSKGKLFYPARDEASVVL